MSYSKVAFNVAFGIMTVCGVCLSACQKPTPTPIDFEIDGVHDITLAENGSELLPVSIHRISGIEEQIQLSIMGLPDGVSASYGTATSSPDFETQLYIKDDSSFGGVNNVTVIGTSSSGVVKTYEFKLTTMPKTCTKKATGLYEGTVTCVNGTGQIYGNVNFAEDTATHNKLYFVLKNAGLYLDVNCNTNQVVLPTQRVGNHVVYGEGMLDENYSTIRLRYVERYNNGDTFSCLTYFRKK